MAARTAMLPPAPREVTLRRRGVALILLLALAARALVRKSWGCGGLLRGLLGEECGGLKQTAAAAAALVATKRRREIA